jgi:hypothetical protein
VKEPAVSFAWLCLANTWESNGHASMLLRMMKIALRHAAGTLDNHHRGLGDPFSSDGLERGGEVWLSVTTRATFP